MYIKILITGLSLLFAAATSYATSPQKIHAGTATAKVIRVKIVFDEDFELRATIITQQIKFLRDSSDGKSNNQFLAAWTAEDPSSLAKEILEKLSKRYRRDFNIQVVATGSPQELVASKKERGSRLLYSIALMKCNCEGTDVILGLRGFPLPDNADHSSLTHGFSDPDTGRFAAAFNLAGDEEYLLKGLLHTVDHELRHLLVGAHTQQEIKADDDGAFMKRTGEVLKRGQWHMPACRDFVF